MSRPMAATWTDAPSLEGANSLPGGPMGISNNEQGILNHEGRSGEPLVALRYFGPAVHKNMPEIGDHRK